MKKVMILLVLLTMLSVESFAQTYYYKYLFSVTTNGVKTKLNNDVLQKGIYLTFAKNKTILAPFTKSDGTSSNSVYSKYIGKSNGIITYSGLMADTYYDMGAAYMMNANIKQDSFQDDKIINFHFKSDYSRLNIEMQSGLVHVLEKQSSPSEQQAPSQFY